MEAAGVEISRDVKQSERLLHEQELIMKYSHVCPAAPVYDGGPHWLFRSRQGLGVLGDPTSSVVIWWSRAERGQVLTRN